MTSSPGPSPTSSLQAAADEPLSQRGLHPFVSRLAKRRTRSVRVVFTGSGGGRVDRGPGCKTMLPCVCRAADATVKASGFAPASGRSAGGTAAVDGPEDLGMPCRSTPTSPRHSPRDSPPITTLHDAARQAGR